MAIPAPLTIPTRAVGAGDPAGDMNAVVIGHNNLISGLATVAGTGVYTDLTSKPTIPTQYTDALAVAANTTAISTAVTPLAPLASPTFTGVPAVPTATAGTSTTQVATTNFVTLGIATLQAQFPNGTPAQLFQSILSAGPNYSTTVKQIIVNNSGTISFDIYPTGPPVNTVAPLLSGGTGLGNTFSCTTGSWTNAPLSYTYQWRRGGTAISGATSATYLSVAADASTVLTCAVVASNNGGVSTAQVSSNSITVAAALRTLALGTITSGYYINEGYYGTPAANATFQDTGYLAVTPGERYAASADVTHSAFYASTALDGNGNPTMVSTYAAANGVCPPTGAFARFSNTTLSTTTITY